MKPLLSVQMFVLAAILHTTPTMADTSTTLSHHMIQQQQNQFQQQRNDFNQQQLHNTQTRILRDNQAQQIQQLNDNMRDSAHQQMLNNKYRKTNQDLPHQRQETQRHQKVPHPNTQ